MLKLALVLLLLATPAFAQQARFTPKTSDPAPLIVGPGAGHPISTPLPEEPPLFNGFLTTPERDMIVMALERMRSELSDAKTHDKITAVEMHLVADAQAAVADVRLIPTIGLALSRATEVEVDKKDENGIMIIDREASRKASQPYCDLLKKINPKAGCTIW